MRIKAHVYTRKSLAATVVAIVVIAGGLLSPSTAAVGASCVGVNKHVWVMYPDPNTGVGVEDVYLNSCKAKALRDKFSQAKDAAGLAALLGSRWWPVGTAAGLMYAWAWNNQSQMIGSSKKNKGVRIRVWAGLVVGCYGQ